MLMVISAKKAKGGIKYVGGVHEIYGRCPPTERGTEQRQNDLGLGPERGTSIGKAWHI